MYRLSWNLGVVTSWNPQGMSRPVMGFLYIYLMYLYNTHVTVEIQFLGTFAKLRKGAVMLIMCVCPSIHLSAWNNLAAIGWIITKFWYFRDFLKSLKKIQVPLKSDENNGQFTGELCTFMIICHWILLGMRNFRQKLYIKSKHAFYFQNFFRKLCTCKILGKSKLKPDRPQMTILGCW